MYYRMPRRVLRLTIVLCMAAAAFGLWLGSQSVPSETEVIEAGAALYEAETRRSASECVGVPGTGLVWISVRCGAGDDARVYMFSRQGTLMSPTDEPPA